MKTLLRLLAGLCVVTCVASASAELLNVPFAITKPDFKPGDSIVIDEVLATSPKLGVGDKVVVRGHYQLASAAKASLSLFITHATPTKNNDLAASTQTTRVEHPTGTFELSCDITYAGDLHVSFYPTTGGASFGGVYFQQR